MEGCVFIDTQSGDIDRDIPEDVIASLLRMEIDEMYAALLRDGEAFNERFLLIADWRTKDYMKGRVPVQ